MERACPSFFPVNKELRQVCEAECVYPPSHFNKCLHWVLGRIVEQSHCGESVSNSGNTDLVFSDDAAIFAESLEVPIMYLEALHKDAKPLEPKVSWPMTRVQMFGGLLDETVVFPRMG